MIPHANVKQQINDFRESMMGEYYNKVLRHRNKQTYSLKIRCLFRICVMGALENELRNT